VLHRGCSNRSAESVNPARHSREANFPQNMSEAVTEGCGCDYEGGRISYGSLRDLAGALFLPERSCKALHRQSDKNLWKFVITFTLSCTKSTDEDCFFVHLAEWRLVPLDPFSILWPR
jgi:hypothetical protein